VIRTCAVSEKTAPESGVRAALPAKNRRRCVGRARAAKVGRTDGRADDRLARNATWGRAVSRGGWGVARGSEKKSHDGIRGRRPDGCAQMLPMSHVGGGCGVRARVVSPPPPRPPIIPFRSSHDNNNILRPADEILYYHCYYYYYSAGVATLPVGDFFSRVLFATYDVATLVRRCKACVVSRDTADNLYILYYYKLTT